MTYQKQPPDGEIVALLWRRDESGLRLADRKYRAYLLSIGRAILSDLQDAEECLNDTYLDAWESIPPNRPASLCAFLATIMRRRALDLLRKHTRLRRRGERESLSLDELSDCFADPASMGDPSAARLGEAISNYLKSVDPRARAIFISRYYLCRPIGTIAGMLGVSRSTVQKQLAALRQGLKNFLESEDFTI